MFYKRVELKEGVKVQFLGVYALKWKHVLGYLDKPTVGFVEAEERELIRYLLDKGVIVTLPQEKRKFKEVKIEDCPVCHGQGATTDHHDPCTECGGSGKVGG